VWVGQGQGPEWYAVIPDQMNGRIPRYGRFFQMLKMRLLAPKKELLRCQPTIGRKTSQIGMGGFERE